VLRVPPVRAVRAARACCACVPPVRVGSRYAAGARRTSPDAQPVHGWLADEPLLVGLGALGRAALLESLQELLDLLDAEATLSAGGAIRLEVAHIGPPTDGAE
jgi:hypothetical protein